MSEQPVEIPVKRPRRLLIVGLATLVLACGGTVTAWRLSSTRGAVAAAPAANEPGMVSFEPFVVNLADQGGTRFLRVSVRIVVDLAAAKRIQSSDLQLMRVRSAVIDVLTRQTADPLVTADGKAALKQAIADRVEPVISSKVIDVLFSDFVVQY